MAGRPVWCVVLLCIACQPGTAAPTLDLPDRPDDAPAGGEIARELRALDFEAREERIHAEVVRGNVPGWLRRLSPVEMTVGVDEGAHRVTIWVTPDYLAVGSDDDFFLVPLSVRTGQRVADLVGASLPTPRMVDAVWASARVRLTPIRFQPDELIATVPYFERHDRLIGAQRALRGFRPGTLVAGHKLDVVLPGSPGATPGQAALYGWHQRDGAPIQPLVNVPLDRPPHFSVGVRLVAREIMVDGAPRDLSDVLRDPVLGPLVYGGPR